MIQTDKVLDAKGLACPMPIVKTRKMIKDMEEGQVLEVQSTDSGTTADLRAWSESAGHQYVGNVEENGIWRHFVRKADSGDKLETVYPFTVDNKQLLESLEHPKAVLIDVRETAEYAFSYIPGALSIPLGQLEEQMQYLDKEHKLYVVCRTGNRSDMACQKLMAAGFECVTNVIPGMSTWDGEIENTIGGMK
ncbi:sulfurtransferase TusA family protein [Sporosarcina sp. GW1-11]|uniref:sulfurtransferase TusA family protein n=1 Tax=Sporosarcina sp. GW1-11 TaxID=2899126 RepID=UPI00294CA2C0|nr:sulfurtransferase TusA family protein [Sporosarcina sp. GW1-11]MDV6379386.1 sulfurtransferase TusA family protein [Sporosarcina sp. GW1-11]